jgi:hypothetical protein
MKSTPLAAALMKNRQSWERALRGIISLCWFLFACFDSVVQMKGLLTQQNHRELSLPPNFFLRGLV